MAATMEAIRCCEWEPYEMEKLQWFLLAVRQLKMAKEKRACCCRLPDKNDDCRGFQYNSE